MGYLHIKNCKSDSPIFLFKECYAMCKVHGTSTHIAYNGELPEGHRFTIFSGGCKREEFVKIFDLEDLQRRINEIGYSKFVLYGEGYGGKMQRMSATYGPTLRFIAFDVKIDNRWLEVPRAEQYAKNLGLDFVPYKRIPCTIEALDAERDAPSEVAIRNGCGNDKLREGIVCRPLMEFSYGTDENSRIICKHKREEFRETKSVRTVQSEEKQKKLDEVTLIVDEWVVPMRLQHVLDKMGEAGSIGIEKTKDVINGMIEDVVRESEGEVVVADEKLLKKEIGNRTAKLFKEYLSSLWTKNQETAMVAT